MILPGKCGMLLNFSTMLNNTFSIAGKNYRQMAPLFLRLIIGFGFMAHGWAKLSRGPGGFEKLLTQLNVPFPHLMSWITPLVEVFGGAAIFLGIFVSITAVPLIVTMMVAMFGIHIHYGFSSIKTIGLTPQGCLAPPDTKSLYCIFVASFHCSFPAPASSP
jgi:putative oxidoreductase